MYGCIIIADQHTAVVVRQREGLHIKALFMVVNSNFELNNGSPPWSKATAVSVWYFCDTVLCTYHHTPRLGRPCRREPEKKKKCCTSSE